MLLLLPQVVLSLAGQVPLTNAFRIVYTQKQNTNSNSEKYPFLGVCCSQKEKQSMEHARGSTKRADAVTNRARILEVAPSVFAERGLDLEMHDVATRAHLGVGTLYGHFANREELLRAIVQRVVEDALAQLRLATQPSADDPRATLQALVAAGVRVQQQYRPLFVVIRDPRLTKLFDPAQADAWREQFLDIAGVVIERGILAGVFPEDLDRDLAAATIIGSFTGAFDLLGQRWTPEELEQRLSQFLWTMLAK
jgi:AcrR family transcriptional regulator